MGLISPIHSECPSSAHCHHSRPFTSSPSPLLVCTFYYVTVCRVVAATAATTATATTAAAGT